MPSLREDGSPFARGFLSEKHSRSVLLSSFVGCGRLHLDLLPCLIPKVDLGGRSTDEKDCVPQDGRPQGSFPGPTPVRIRNHTEDLVFNLGTLGTLGEVRRINKLHFPRLELDPLMILGKTSETSRNGRLVCSGHAGDPRWERMRGACSENHTQATQNRGEGYLSSRAASSTSWTRDLGRNRLGHPQHRSHKKSQEIHVVTGCQGRSSRPTPQRGRLPYRTPANRRAGEPATADTPHRGEKPSLAYAGEGS